MFWTPGTEVYSTADNYFANGQREKHEFLENTLHQPSGSSGSSGDKNKMISCNSCYPLAIKHLFVLHELVSLCHAVIEFAMAIHINLCLDWLLQALQKRLYGLQEGDIGAC